MKKSCLLLSCFAVAGMRLAAWAEVPALTVFERDFAPGPFLNGDPWETRHGFMEVAEGAGLRLAASHPPGILVRVLDPQPEADVLFLETVVRPAVGSELALSTRITAGPAGIGFLLRDLEKASLLARDGFSGEWVDTGVSVPVDSGGTATRFHQLTFRLDRRVGVYDVYWDGAMVDYDLGMPPPLASGQLAFRILGTSVGDTFVQDFLASEHNPLHADTLGSGIPDDWLVARGINPDQPHRYAELQGGSWTVEEYFAEVRPAVHLAGREARSRRNRGAEGQAASPGLVVFTPLERRVVVSR